MVLTGEFISSWGAFIIFIFLGGGRARKNGLFAYLNTVVSISEKL